MIQIRKTIKSFSYAFKGIFLLFKNENNARVHLLASILVINLGFFLKLDGKEWLWIILAIALVWITEAINTSIEKLVDLVHPGFEPKAGYIKDLAAAAVLFAAIFSLIITVFILLPKILKLL